VCLFVSGSKVKKTFSMIFLLSRSTSKNHGLGRNQRSKKHCLLPDSKFKKTFSMIFLLLRSMSKNMVLVGFKGKKNIFYFQFEYRKNTDCSSSEVMGRISEMMSIETSRCYAFAQDHID
jgi:hypothetical protein